MKSQGNATNRSAEQRFARFQARPDIRRITAQYADWAESADGSIVTIELAALAMARSAGQITRQNYRSSLRKLARTCGLPQADFRLLAECSREFTRFALAGSGQIPFATAQWDAEEAGI